MLSHDSLYWRETIYLTSSYLPNKLTATLWVQSKSQTDKNKNKAKIRPGHNTKIRPGHNNMKKGSF